MLRRTSVVHPAAKRRPGQTGPVHPADERRRRAATAARAL